MMANTAVSAPAKSPVPVQPSKTADVSVRPTVKRAPQGRRYYFAYGANLSTNVRERRNLKPESISTGTVLNWKLRFDHGGGYGNIAYAPEDTGRPDVEGAVLDLSESEMSSLQRIELGYDLRHVAVRERATGDTILAEAFVTGWWFRIPGEAAPTADYIGKILSGAQCHGLSKSYLDWLQRYASRELPPVPGNSNNAPVAYAAGAFCLAVFVGVNMLLVRPRALV